MESVVIMSEIDPKDDDLMAAEALLRLLEYSLVTPEEIEAEFNPRIKSIVMTANVNDAESVRRLPLKIKMLVLAQKIADLKSISREYSYYRDGLWERLPEKDPHVLASYYYELSDIFHEFEEYDAFSEYNGLVARLFVKFR